jgi:SAM-dependent methyltransferase
MSTSIFYRHPWLYEGLMRVLYLGGYKQRSQALAALIPEGSSVVDVCCGPGTLYFSYLRLRHVTYTGLDINRAFVNRLVAFGHNEAWHDNEPRRPRVSGMVWDASAERPLPRADYLVMQASLYHFLPDPRPLVDRMLVAAKEKVILTEPVRNLADSKNPALAWLSRKLTNPGTGDQPRRFNEARFENFIDEYRAEGRVIEFYPIAGGRERLCVLQGRQLETKP